MFTGSSLATSSSHQNLLYYVWLSWTRGSRELENGWKLWIWKKNKEMINFSARLPLYPRRNILKKKFWIFCKITFNYSKWINNLYFTKNKIIIKKIILSIIFSYPFLSCLFIFTLKLTHKRVFSVPFLSFLFSFYFSKPIHLFFFFPIRHSVNFME